MKAVTARAAVVAEAVWWLGIGPCWRFQGCGGRTGAMLLAVTRGCSGAGAGGASAPCAAQVGGTYRLTMRGCSQAVACTPGLRRVSSGLGLPRCLGPRAGF